MKFSKAVLLLLAMSAVSAIAFAQDPYANAPAYLQAVPGTGVRKIQPLVTTGQKIPLAGSASERFLFVGIPDGMGAYRTARTASGGEFKLTVNHEFRPNQGVAFGSLPGGARISELTVGYTRAGGGGVPSLSVKDGRLAFTKVFGTKPDGSYGEIVTPASGFGRLCSATLGFQNVGFDRPIHFAGEENGPPNNFYGDGSVGTATFDGAAHILPDVGKFDFENLIPLPFTGNKTVLIMDEDAGALDSQVYMYVGTKDPSSADPLKKNGLVGGDFYVFVGNDPAQNSEATFKGEGSTTVGHWEKLNGPPLLSPIVLNSAAAIQSAAAAKNAFGFVRVEDGTADQWHPGVFYFVTTGSPGSVNPFGRLYKMQLNPLNPTGPTMLKVLLDGDVKGADGKPRFVSPDNIDINRHGELIFLEDPNYNLATDLGLARDTSIFLYNTRTGELSRVAEMDRAAAAAHALAADPTNTNGGSANSPGGWEFSGVIDTESILGRGSWIIDVQAHSLRINPTAATVEGGQVFYLNVKPNDDENDEDDD